MRRIVTATNGLRQSSTPSRTESFYSTVSSLIRRSSTFERAYLSPFDRLPVELHAEIFALCLDPFPHLIVGEDEPPLVIARVCRAWRALVMSTPRLWSTFEIEVVDDSPPAAEPRRAALKLLKTVKIWLERSRNYPLSIRLTHVPTTYIPDSLPAQLLAMLISQARRWRHIEFVVPSPSLSAIQALLPEDFPVLKDLKIHMKGQWNGVPFSLRSVNIPWAQLTEVDLRLDHAHLLNLDEYLDLLSDASNLVSCSFNANCVLSSSREVHASRKDASDRLYLPALQKLHLILQDSGVLDSSVTTHPGPQSPFLRPPQSLISFLHRFTECKKLTTLELDWLIDSTTIGANTNTINTNQWDASSYSSFRSLLQTLSPSLHSIRLAYLPLGEEQLLQSLAQLSGLVSLDLRFSLADHEQDPITDRFFRSLTASPPTPLTPTPGVPHHQPSGSGLGSGSGSGLNLGLGLELSSGLRSRRNASPSPPGTTVVANEVVPKLLLPDLTRVRIQCSGEQCSQEALLELIRSRIEGAHIRGRRIPPLEQFHFYSMSPVLRNTARHVDQWNKLGVDVMLESVVIL